MSPIKIGKKVYEDFEAAAEHIARVKKIPIKNARAYVAKIEQQQKKGRKHK